MKIDASVMSRARSHLCYWAALSLTLLGAGCANQTPNRLTLAPASIQAHAYCESVDINGRFFAQFERDNNPESWNGSFSWTQSPQGLAVTLQSPFGQTLATITVNESGATLTQSGQAPRRAADVDALARNALGWPLPISNLRDWLQAYAVTANGNRILATSQSTAPIVTRDGWRLHYVSWLNNEETGMQDVPKRIDMERDTQEAGELRMRLVVTSVAFRK